jgi:hypothetical protein
MRTTVRISTALSAAVSIPITMISIPPMAIPIGITAAAGTVIVAAIVIWHLKLGGRALIRRSPKGTLTFVLDAGRRPATQRRP